ncbi:leucyl aminopeptidase [Glaciibacter sp. 2TAF33]|uniref:leucyl aminopeptidase n=1 Tax=Glaciibacter sp. 2TAF33 TaxID=3233015 RepID=UPI003F93CDBB
MPSSPYKLIPDTFTPAPSSLPANAVGVLAVDELSADLDAVGYFVGPGDDAPDAVDTEALRLTGFDGKAGKTFLQLANGGPAVVVVGAGPADEQNEATLRDAAAAFARAAARYARLGINTGTHFPLDPGVRGQVITEGAVLARYRYTAVKPNSTNIPLVSLDILAEPNDREAVAEGVRRGEIVARAANLARDLANCPPGHLTATDFADFAVQLGSEHGFDVTVFDKQQIIDLGCGGLLGVNAGSVEEPRIIKLHYAPSTDDGSTATPTGHLAFVGKGIMYDSGGISLKPSDPMHLAMKMDMAGAAAVLAAVTTLGDLGCSTEVTAFLMCTDNMPSGSAMKLGDVLTIRNGTTVEVKNTDAEGRLVMSDALVLAREEHPDAIVDIATLTGAALAALGHLTAVLIGNNPALVEQAKAASRLTDESVWELPLERRYRGQLDSDVADMSNMGGKYAGATIAALFLADFVDDVPWAHFDIAGTMQAESDDSWRSKGATGFGARLLAELALDFTPVT